MNKIILFLSLVFITSSLNAQEDFAEEVYSYDAIVDQLSSSRTEQPKVYKDPYENVRFHIGAGFSQSILNVKGGSSSNAIMMSGMEIRMGINMLNPQWVAEGSLRNYNDKSSKGSSFELREFEAKIVHTKPYAKNLFYRVGTGLAARYLKSDVENKNNRKDYSTPSLILMAGSGHSINENLAIVGDVAFKTSIVNDTVDKNTLDFTLRLDTSF